MSGFTGTACAVLALTQTERVRNAVLAVDVGVPVHVDQHLGRGAASWPGAEDLVGQAAADHLSALGHRTIAHLPGLAGSLSGLSRSTTFTEALQRAVEELGCSPDTAALAPDRVRRPAQRGAGVTFREAVITGLSCDDETHRTVGGDL